MTTEPTADPLFDALSRLPPIAPGESHDRRIRTRCYEVLTHQRAKRRTRSRGVADLTIVCAVAVYIAAVVTTAVELLGVLSG